MQKRGCEGSEKGAPRCGHCAYIPRFAELCTTPPCTCIFVVMVKRLPASQEREQYERSDRRSQERAAVVALPIERDEESLVVGLRAGEPWAHAMLYDRYAPRLARTLRRLVGSEIELEDLLHDTFVQAYASVEGLREPQALWRWLQIIAVRTAYRAIRYRRLTRWLRFWAPAELHELEAPEVSDETLEAYRRTYALLSKLPARERVPFALRFVEGMELTEIAAVCAVSLATVKRRLQGAQKRFARAAANDELLRSWLEQGGRWSS